MASPPPPPHGPSSIFRFSPNSSSSSTSNFPILAVAVIGILATALLLVGYYIFVIKCCLNWHRIDLLRRFSPSHRHRHRPGDNPSPVHLPSAAPRGLDESLIRLIPVIRFRKESTDGEETECLECAVCLSDFKEEEKLRVIPNCCHAFHIDCIDVWLQNNANCPLCRSSISSNTLSSIDRILNYSNLPSRDPNPEEFVVIEIQGNNFDEPRLITTEERASGAVSAFSITTEQGKPEKESGGRLLHLSSMDDEWINTRNKDDVFGGAQPIRRSISMDLSSHRQLCLEIQEVLEQSRMQGKTGMTSSSNEEESSSSNSNSNRGMRRSFFSFGSGKGGSRNAGLPL